MMPDDFQIPVNEFDDDPGEYLPSESIALLGTNFGTEFISENVDSSATPILAPAYLTNEQPLYGDLFDESHLLDPFKSIFFSY